ncbi:hypothetical protein [uncultured Amphritea sp.]|uniref:IS66 family insertion sequence element accessory protein TnpA n=1 Tax=uncultured Amphritea sp. TaxID=981605 RepID=UPI0026092813|nr:hypothetical protein [uncultured Amphritea sp.]
MTTEQKRTFWQKHIDGWQQSGLSQPEYCKQHDLKLANFGYWRTRLSKPKRSNKFIPVDLGPNVQARVSLPNGVRLEVPIHTLADVLLLLNRVAREDL